MQQTTILTSTMPTNNNLSPPQTYLKESIVVNFLWRSLHILEWRDAGNLSQVDETFTVVEVVGAVVVAQLMLHGVEHEPSLLPALQQSTALVQITAVCLMLCITQTNKQTTVISLLLFLLSNDC